MNQLWWYTARAGGIVAWALVAASVLWGLFLSTKALGKKARPNWLLDLHRFLGAAAVVFSAIHVGAILLDTYTSFGLSDVLVPFASSWHPVAVAWGVVGLYLLAAVEITSLLRPRIPKRLWRLTHLASFPLYLSATIHTLFAGTDASSPVLRIVMLATTAAIAGLTAQRVLSLSTPKPARTPAPSTTTPRTPTPSSRDVSTPELSTHHRTPAGAVR